MLKNIIWVSVLIFFSSCCDAQHRNQIVLLKKVDDISFYYIDYYNNITSYRQLVNEGKVKSDGTITIQTEFPLIVTVTKNRANYPVYLKPGDTCSILAGNHDTLLYKFERSRNSDELDFLVTLEKKTGFTFPDLNVELTPRLNMNAYLEMHRELYEKRTGLLKTYCDSLNLSSSFFSEMNGILHYKFLTGALKPFYIPVQNFDYTTLPKQYLDEIKTFKNHANDSFSTNMYYRLFILNYNKYLTKQYLQSSTPYTFENLFASARNNFSGKSREYLMFLLLKENASKALPNFSQYVSDFKKECSDQKFVHYIDSIWVKESTRLPIELTSTSLESAYDSTSTWQAIINKSKDKVIYIDFWASWCSPCLQEMPNSELLQSIVGNDNVSFVYISIDRKSDAWKKGIAKLPKGVQKSEHYRLDASTNLGKYFDLTSIPRYVIIDKDGSISAFNAGRPGSEDTRTVLERLSSQ